MPSWGEGFGLVFAEAMSHGLPCIASRFDAGSEVVVDGVTGILVDPNRSDELLGALRTLLSDGRLRRRMGEAGRTRAKEVFSLRAFNRRVESILRWEVLEH
jgi:phosphatidylinositol alpha-1,6-mannosyltransferase